MFLKEDVAPSLFSPVRWSTLLIISLGRVRPGCFLKKDFPEKKLVQLTHTGKGRGLAEPRRRHGDNNPKIKAFDTFSPLCWDGRAI